MSAKVRAATIAVDIDDVLFPFVEGIADYHNDVTGSNLTLDDYATFDFSAIWGLDAAAAEEIVGDFMQGDNLHMQPLAGARDALRRLSQNYNVVLVTARNQYFEADTIAWLERHLSGLFQKVIFAGNPHDGRLYRPKGEVCRELGVELLIDDHPRNLLSAAEHGIDGVLFGLKPWSVLDGVSTRITPCRDWSAVMEHIYHGRS